VYYQTTPSPNPYTDTVTSSSSSSLIRTRPRYCHNPRISDLQRARDTHSPAVVINDPVEGSLSLVAERFAIAAAAADDGINIIYNTRPYLYVVSLLYYIEIHVYTIYSNNNIV